MTNQRQDRGQHTYGDARPSARRPAAHYAPHHAASQGTRRQQRPAQRRPSRQTRASYPASQRRPAYRERPRRRRRSFVAPLIACVFAVLLVGGGTFFALRSCSRGAGSGRIGATDGTAVSTADAPSLEPGMNEDGSVDVNLMMVGDILFHYQVRQSGLKDDGTRNYDHVFEHVLDELEGQDIKVLNQETPIAGPIYTGAAPDGYDGYPEFNGPQEVGDSEARAGFNVVLKATNHAMDNGTRFDDIYTLVKSEQSFWKQNHPEVAVIGEVDPDDETTSVDDVYVYEKAGFKIALLNYTFDLNGFADPRGAVSMLEEEHVRTTMAAAREQADMIVVFPHWGEEYSLEPVDDQYYWANLLMEEGADVIIGNHPHVIEPVQLLDAPAAVGAETDAGAADGAQEEKPDEQTSTADAEDATAAPAAKKVPCYWSTGNFISTSPSDQSLVGGMAKVTLHKDAAGTCSVTSATFKPLISHLGLSTDMTTYMIGDWTDELAASNWLDTDVNPDTDNTTLTPAWASQFCSEVLGEGYDAATGTFTLDLS